MSETINGRIVKSNQQKMEELYCWSAFWGNAKGLAVSTTYNEVIYNKTQIQIANLRQKLFGK